MYENNCAMMCWNVRGLNSPAKREVIREVADEHRLAILCLQETKLETWTPQLARDVGGSRLDGCTVLLAMGTRGGLAIFWDKEVLLVDSHALGQFSITVSVRDIASSTTFWLTNVYGPTNDNLKDAFLAEIAAAALPLGQPWLLMGDFNIIYQASDKSNLNINRRIMGRFRRAIDFAGLREIKCKNRKFTWSNERELPTFCSIDKIFCNND
nr:uncharacterized protein LOC123493747 [Aegilops tauschii subsp. strangulata]